MKVSFDDRSEKLHKQYLHGEALYIFWCIWCRIGQLIFLIHRRFIVFCCERFGRFPGKSYVVPVGARWR
jgi:hypothetical protein